jgi:hypothetical protein
MLALRYENRFLLTYACIMLALRYENWFQLRKYACNMLALRYAKLKLALPGDRASLIAEVRFPQEEH